MRLSPDCGLAVAVPDTVDPSTGRIVALQSLKVSDNTAGAITIMAPMADLRRIMARPPSTFIEALPRGA
jgi:hypothetical protein